MLAVCQSSIERLDLERKVLAAAFKQSFESGDSDGAALAHKGLCAIIQQQLFSGDSSSGSVVPAGFWQKASQALDEQNVDVAEAAPSNGHEVGLDAGQPVTTIGDAGAAAAEAFSQMAAAASDTSAEVDNSAPVTAEESGLTPDSHLPSAGPMSYLDFGGDEAEASAAAHEEPVEAAAAAMEAVESEQSGAANMGEMLDVLQTENRAPETESPSQMIKRQSFYQMLGVNKLSSYERIHISFLRLVRRLLRALNATQIRDKREFREVLRSICIAHDVLKDPITRTDYDLRMLGMRSQTGHIEHGADGKAGGLGARIRLMLGELLECADVLEPAELQIALDMHKAEPGMQFGEFLVAAHFLNREELDSALMAQRLIDSGKITVAQFQSAMFRMRDSGAAFFDTLMVEGWIQPRDVFDENSELWQDINGPQQGSGVSSDSAQQGRGSDSDGNTDAQGASGHDSEKPSGDWADNVEWLEDTETTAAKARTNDLKQAALDAERELLNFIDAPDETTESGNAKQDFDAPHADSQHSNAPHSASADGTASDTTKNESDDEAEAYEDISEDTISIELENLSRSSESAEFMNAFLAEAQEYEGASDPTQESSDSEPDSRKQNLLEAIEALPDAEPDADDSPDKRENESLLDSDEHGAEDGNSNRAGDEDSVKVSVAKISPEKLGVAARLLQHIKGKKVEFSDKWTEKDAMAETQSIDMTAVKAMIDSHRSEDKD